MAIKPNANLIFFFLEEKNQAKKILIIQIKRQKYLYKESESITRTESRRIEKIN